MTLPVPKTKSPKTQKWVKNGFFLGQVFDTVESRPWRMSWDVVTLQHVVLNCMSCGVLTCCCVNCVCCFKLQQNLWSWVTVVTLLRWDDWHNWFGCRGVVGSGRGSGINLKLFLFPRQLVTKRYVKSSWPSWNKLASLKAAQGRNYNQPTRDKVG